MSGSLEHGPEQVADPARERRGLRSRRTVLILLGTACLIVFAAGVLAGWVNRHHTICTDGKAPLAQRAGILGDTEFRCHNGQTVTLSS
jgi:hypothetical protein